MVASTFLTSADFRYVLYIIAFSLFIYGLMGLTGPKTAVQGNRIAAVGMAVAVIATFLIPGIGNWGLIIVGIVIRTAGGIPARRPGQVTAMPRLVGPVHGALLVLDGRPLAMPRHSSPPVPARGTVRAPAYLLSTPGGRTRRGSVPDAGGRARHRAPPAPRRPHRGR